ASMVALAFALYFLVILFVGFLSARRSSRSVADFFLGGRRMGSWVVALSAVASGRSAWLVLGLSGMAYTKGVSAVWACVGYIIVELLLFIFLGRRLRNFTGEKGDITLPDFLESRFSSPALRVISVIILLAFLTTYLGAQMLGGGKAFLGSLNIPQGWGLVLTAGIVFVYTIVGGFYAVSYTDVIQALFMILGLVVLPVVALVHQGGIQPILETLRALDPRLVDPWTLGAGGTIGLLGIGLGSPGNPHILVRYMSARDTDILRKSALIGTVWNVIMAWGAVMVGLVGRKIFPLANMLVNSDPENLYSALAQSYFHQFLFGLVMAAVFAAIMSTVDSQLLVASSAVARDIYQRFWGRRASERVMVWLSRGSVVLITGVALVLGYIGRNSQLVFWFVLLAWAGLGAAFGSVVILGLYWKRATAPGAIAGLLVGAITVFAWKLSGLSGFIYELVPAFILATVAVFVFSFLKKPAKDAQKGKS
ncbi:MAG: sodium/proline symporter, partial [Candidatus Hydrothermia bacterium]